VNVIVFGCGPTGLMAVHAAKLAGATRVNVVSKKRKSHLYGAQYLHAPIPGMTESAPVVLRYALRGTVEGYRDKVYGGNSRVEVSPEALTTEHDAWDIRRTYDNLWNAYEALVIDCEVGPLMVKEAVEDFDLVINTIPRPSLCTSDAHTFQAEYVWALGDAPDRGQFVPMRRASHNNTVLCSGEPDVAWYRLARVFDHCTVEYPHLNKPPFEEVAEVTKPLSHNCDCHSDDVLHVGRYGKWQKGVLTTDAFTEVMDRCLALPV
jgi:hypothetical protein